MVPIEDSFVRWKGEKKVKGSLLPGLVSFADGLQMILTPGICSVTLQEQEQEQEQE